MNCINFLYILFCLFSHASILYPLEKKDSTKKPWSSKNWKSPLMDIETYKDSSGIFHFR